MGVSEGGYVDAYFEVSVFSQGDVFSVQGIIGLPSYLLFIGGLKYIYGFLTKRRRRLGASRGFVMVLPSDPAARLILLLTFVL